MKQQNLKDIRDYRSNPRSSAEGPDANLRDDLTFTQSDYDSTPTKQSEAAACDINDLMDRYQNASAIPHDGRVAMNFDYTTRETFEEAMNIIANANSSFHALPASVRAEFKNNPAELLEYIERAPNDPAATKKLIDLGLAEVVPPKPESPTKVLEDIRENTRAKPKADAPKNKQGAD